MILLEQADTTTDFLFLSNYYLLEQPNGRGGNRRKGGGESGVIFGDYMDLQNHQGFAQNTTI